MIKNTVLNRGYDVPSNLSDPGLRYQLIESQRDSNALYQTAFEICQKSKRDYLRYMGTTSVVQDINYITTLLEGNDSLLSVPLLILFAVS